MRRLSAVLAVGWAAVCGISAASAAELSPLELLGKRIFFDTSLSMPAGLSCASCHSPQAGFTSPHSELNLRDGVHRGAVPGRFGNRKPPSAAYAAFSPPFHYDNDGQSYMGGQFWDGRARNLADQATKPLLNPLEQNNTGGPDLLRKIARAQYHASFVEVFGVGTLPSTEENEGQILQRIAAAIAAYESSKEVNPFSSKYDAYLRGEVELTQAEARGLVLYEGRANCKSCHPHQPSANGQPPLFTDFTYDNLGIPRNAQNPFYRMPAEFNPDGPQYVDLGLGAILKDPKQNGRFKVPTLRNVDRRPGPNVVKAYGHNGYFKSLKEIVHFYNARDTAPEDFGPPEVPETVNREELGSLGLTDAEEDDVVAFLRTLSDGYRVPGGIQHADGEGPSVSEDDEASFSGAQDVIRVMRFQLRQRVASQDEAPPRR